MASEAYHIGAASPSQSYLNMEKIAETAISLGADAIHPGYGFLSENEDFADLVRKRRSTSLDLLENQCDCVVIKWNARMQWQKQMCQPSQEVLGLLKK